MKLSTQDEIKYLCSTHLWHLSIYHALTEIVSLEKPEANIMYDVLRETEFSKRIGYPHQDKAIFIALLIAKAPASTRQSSLPRSRTPHGNLHCITHCPALTFILKNRLYTRKVIYKGDKFTTRPKPRDTICVEQIQLTS